MPVYALSIYPVSGYFMSNGKIVSGKTSPLPRTPFCQSGVLMPEVVYAWISTIRLLRALRDMRRWLSAVW